MIRNTQSITQDFYSKMNQTAVAETALAQAQKMILRGVTYVGYHYGGNKVLKSLDGMEAFLLRGHKYFYMEYERLIADFSKLYWSTYCLQFKPLLFDMGKWQDRPVPSPTTDNLWGCTIRCLQMLVANSLSDYEDVSLLFDNDLRGAEAAFGI